MTKLSAALSAVLNFAKREGMPVEGDNWKWTAREQMQQLWGDAEVITDDNLMSISRHQIRRAAARPQKPVFGNQRLK